MWRLNAIQTSRRQLNSDDFQKMLARSGQGSSPCSPGIIGTCTSQRSSSVRACQDDASISLPKSSHLTTLCNDHILLWPITRPGPNVLDLLNHIHPIHNFPKNNMLPIQMRRGNSRNKELTTIRIRSRILLTQSAPHLPPTSYLRTYRHTQ